MERYYSDLRKRYSSNFKRRPLRLKFRPKTQTLVAALLGLVFVYLIVHNAPSRQRINYASDDYEDEATDGTDMDDDDVLVNTDFPDSLSVQRNEDFFIGSTVNINSNGYTNDTTPTSS